MKWAVFIFAMAVIVPFLAQQVATRPKIRSGIVWLITVLLFNPAHINLISDENYRGDSRGIEITSVDLLLWSLWMGRKEPAGRESLVLVRFMYLLALLLSVSASPSALRSSYSIWKFIRMCIYFSVMEREMRHASLVKAALGGLGTGVILEGVTSLWQKYVHHAVRTVGMQSHPNSMAMIVNLLSPIALALLLANQAKKSAWAVVILAAACNVFSLSRGGMMMFVLAATVVMMGSFYRGATKRKWMVLSSMVLGAVIAIAKSFETIVKRFTEAPKESELARKLFNKAAKAMADNNTFGVGVNMYSWVLDHGGYADMFNIEPGDRNGIAHHIYWLTTAETGYFGVTMYILMLVVVIGYAAWGIRNKDLRGDIALGAFAGLLVTYTQGTAEWIARQTNQSYAFWTLAAMVVAFAHPRWNKPPYA